MRALAWLFVAGCAASATRPHHTPPPPHAQPAPVIALGSIDDVTDGGELVRALAEHREPHARLVEIAELRWRDRAFDKTVLAEMIAKHTDGAYRAQFRTRFGVDYDELWNVFLAGYAAQLAERFGIAPGMWGITEEHGKWALFVAGKLGDQFVDWRSGVFAPRSSPIVPQPMPATVPATSSHTMETVITAWGDYYSLPELGYPVQFRPHGDEPRSDKLFEGGGYRMYLEAVAYTDVTGRHYQRAIASRRTTPYFIVRPGGLPRLGLTKSIHLVRIELDDSALPGSSPLVEKLAVLDGTSAFSVDLEKAFGQVQQRFDADAHTAEVRLASEVAATEQAFAIRRGEWLRTLPKPAGAPRSSKRDDVTQRPTFHWDGHALTITMHREHRIVFSDEVPYPNPELEHWSCPPGRACAVPPRELVHELDQRHTTEIEASYTIEPDGGVHPRGPATATLHQS